MNKESNLASNVATNTARQIIMNNNKNDKKIIVSDDEEDDEYTNDSDNSECNDSECDDSECDDSESDDTESESDSELSESDTERLSESIECDNEKLSNRGESKSSSYSDNLDNDDGIETIETSNNKNNLVGGICYLELLSELNETKLNDNLSFNDSDLNQCIKIISINSGDVDDSCMKVLELNDNLLTNINKVVEETILNSNSQDYNDDNLNKLLLNVSDNMSDIDAELKSYTLDDIKDMKKTKLQDLCKRKNISTNGTRNELIIRLSGVL
jgi:hypothetical protein